MNAILIYLLIGFCIGIYVSNNTSDEDIYTAINMINFNLNDNYKNQLNPNNIRLQLIIFSTLFWPYVLIKML